jgi:hypothetical protein
MKKIILLEEINRIHELMGVSTKKTLIMEGGIGEAITKGLEKIFDMSGAKAAEKLSLVTSELEKVLEKTERESLEQLTKVATTAEEKMAVISKFIEENKSIQEKMLTHLKQEFGENVKKVYDSYLEQPGNLDMLDDWYTQTLDRGGESMADEYSKKAFKEIMTDMGLPGDVVDEYLKKTEVTFNNGKAKLTRVGEKIEQGIEDLGQGPGLNESQNRIVRESISNPERGTQAGWEKLLNSVVEAMNLEDIQTYLRSIRYFFKNQQEVALRFNEVADRAQKKMDKNLDIKNDLKEMADILIASKRKFDESYKFIYNDWIKNIPKPIRQELERYGDTNKFKKLFDRMNKDRNIFFAFTQEWEAYKKMFKIFRIFAKKDTPGFLIFRGGAEGLEAWKRVGMFISTMDPRFVSEWAEALMSRGIRKDIAMNIVFRFISHAFIFPAAVYSLQATVKAGFSILESLLNIAGVPEALKLLGLSDGSDINFVNYNENNEDFANTLKHEWLEKITKHFPSNNAEYLDSATQITLIDDFFYNVVKPFVTGKISADEYKQKINEYINKSDQEFEKWLSEQKELTEEMKRQFREYRKKAIEALKNNGVVPPVSTQTPTPSPTPTPQTSGDSTITATPDGFKKFLELKGETGTFNSADSIGTDSKGNDYYYDINDKTFQPLD